jgi:hypothetical protein
VEAPAFQAPSGRGKDVVNKTTLLALVALLINQTSIISGKILMSFAPIASAVRFQIYRP